MAIPGTPTNFNVQSANQQILVSWDQMAGATSYLVQRSLDNVTFTTVSTISGSPLTTSYLDTSVSTGTQYWYQVASSNTSGDSSYTIPQSAIPTQSGEFSLAAIRLQSQQRADRVNSNFVTTTEWNKYINQAMFELYDLLVTVYEDYFMATPVTFTVDGSTFLFDLPNGSNTFTNALTNASFTPPALYKLVGVDLALNTSNNAYVTVSKFQFEDRNRFVYPNSASTIYGVFNLQYRLMGTQIMFIPTPSAGQQIRLWYVPRMTELLKDTDTTTSGISGWIEYAIVRAAKYALDKEESDTTKLDQQLLYLKTRIEESAMNRDAGEPDKVSDTRIGDWGNNWGGGRGGSTAGWLVGLFPFAHSNNIGNSLLAHSIFFSQTNLRYVFFGVALAYFYCFSRRQLSLTISLPNMTSFFWRGLSIFINHIKNVVTLCSKKEVFRIYAHWIVAPVTYAKPVAYRTFKNLICDFMGRSPFMLNGKPSSFWHAPSSRVTTASPKPARSSLINFFHKPLLKIFHNLSILHRVNISKGLK